MRVAFRYSDTLLVDTVNEKETKFIDVVNVADINGLKLVDTSNVTNYPNKTLINVVSGGLYIFNRTSTTTPDDINVVQPTIGVGRWIKLNPPPTSNMKKFESVKCPKPLLSLDADKGVQLNRRRFTHILGKIRENTVIISANEIDDSIIEFFELFYGANYKYVAYCNNGEWSNFKEIDLNDTQFPLSYIDDSEYLPELTISFVAMEV